jgi:hypothetical protein
LLDLERKIAYFVYHKQYDVISELNADGTELVGSLKLRGDPPFDAWGGIVGDVVHNLRSALEHLAWQIVDANGGAVGTDVKFPIYKVERDYLNWRRPIPERKRRDPFAGVDQRAIEAIEAEEPYAGHDGDPAQHPLAVLNAMWNRDKHQILTPAVFQYPGPRRPPGWPDDASIVGVLIEQGAPFGCEGFETTMEPKVSEVLERRGRIEDNEHLVTFFGKATRPEPKVNVYGNLTPEICLDDGSILTDALRRLFIAVQGTVERLAVWVM